jgi:hypothetical protein
MGRPSKEILEFMSKHSIDNSEIWEVHGNSWCIKHKALERAGAAAGIIWDRPAMIETNLAAGIVAICVFGKLGERVEWSIGEASPKNCKNSYSYAMAEKRGKDRCILKLLNTHGYLYSEAEFEAEDKPSNRQNPHVTRPEDIYDGEISHDIPVADGPVQKMKVKDARLEYPVLLKEMQRCQDPDDLREWAVHRKADIQSLPGQWPEMFRIEYTKHKNSLSPNVLMAG